MENTAPKMTAAERRGPPMPDGMFKIANAFAKLVLRSPFHKLLSKNLILLTFTGRKSGRSISTPVGYLREGNILTVFSFSGWWRNIQANPEVTVRLRGKDMKGRARIVSDLPTVAQSINNLVDARGEEMGKRMGFERIPDGTSSEEIERRSANVIFIQIEI